MVKKECVIKISASVGTTPKAHAPTHTFNLERHFGRLHPEILKLVQRKDNALPGTPTTSNIKTFEYREKPATATLTKFFS